MTDYWAVGILNADKLADGIAPILKEARRIVTRRAASRMNPLARTDCGDERLLTEHRFDRWMNRLDRLACKGGCETDCVRASGEVICDRCGNPYRKHRYCVQSELPRNGSRYPSYFLHVLCDGTHVKL